MIRKAIMAAFLLIPFAVSISIGSDNEIKNEYWTWDNGTPQSLIFENYFFSEDGTFSYSWGYSRELGSGKSNSGGWYAGTYFYSAAKNKIILNVTGNGTMGASGKIERTAPKELKIHEFIGNDTVRIDFKTAHHKNSHNLFDGVMKRHLGRIKEQRWVFMHYTTVREFYFDPQGNCFYKEGKQGADIDAQYECEYNIIDDILFLNVKAASTKNRSTKKYDNVKYEPAVKTYIRIAKADSGEIQIENVNFGSILAGSRNWDYADGEYKAKNKLPEVKQKDFYTYKIERKNTDNINSLDELSGREVTIY